ncbi:RSP_7527 family protein [Paroceanicella profunda]|uniref:RSP_7527 family protein n=1 Tax=Paroceanicella profunda TaxID=2579971 RepID=UPI001478CB60|nr:hypothetical protein [Paroceanicella profunda]
MTMTRSVYPSYDEITRIEREARAYRAAVLRSGVKASGRGLAAVWRAITSILHRPTAA